MAETPSYSEIVNTPVNPTTGSGTAAVVLDNSDEIARLNQQAQFKAENDWRKYNMFLNNFKDLAKDANTIAALPVATTDRPILQKQMIDIMGEISKNPASALGGKGMFDIQQKLQKLTSDAHESKANNAFDLAHRQFILKNPDFKTDENTATIEGYLKNKPLGTREPYMLDTTPKFDLGKFVQTGYELPGVKSPYANAGVTPDGQNIFEDTGEVWNPEPFNKYFTGGLQRPDIRKAAQNLYNQLPPEKKKAYEQGEGVPLEKFWDDIKKTYTPPEGTYIKKRDLKGNPNYLEKEKLAEKTANDKAKLGLEWYDSKTRRINATKSDGTPIATDIKGNALNGIPLTDITKEDGEYNLSSGAGKQYLGQLQQVMGEKVLPNSILRSDAPEDAISIKVKGGVVQSIQVKDKIYDRQEIENMQRARDKEAKGASHQEYPVEQAFLNPNAKQNPETKSTISLYPANIQAGIKAFAAANKMSEEEAIKVLKANKKI